MRYFSPLRLAGPVFDKELRVASRQRKSYVLRFAYVSLLTFIVVWIWFVFVRDGSRGAVAYQVSRTGEAGKYIAVTIVWFQFIATQFLAFALLGSTISGEIRARTLHVLAATPISGVQIVGGKLAGGLVHVVTLLATSLPLLAIVRVFGGVPWDYLLSGVCITFSATVFAGALSLLISAFYPNVFVFVGVVQAVWYGVLGRVFDGLIEWLAHYNPVIGVMSKPVMLINPTDVLLARTKEMLGAQPSTGLSSWWPLHCLILLAGSVVVLLLTARRIRAVAAVAGPDRAHECGTYRLTMWAGKKGTRAKGSLDRRTRHATAIRRVEGSPVFWKELRKSAKWRSRRPLVRYGVYTAVVFLYVAVTIGIPVIAGGSYRLPAILLMSSGLVLGLHVGLATGLTIGAAGAISKEREARTLPVLLTTPLDDREIIKDKAIAVLRWGLAFLAALSVPFLVSLILLMKSTIKVGLLTILCGAGLYLVSLLGIMSFLIGVGLYCSVWLKTTAGATGCTFAILLGSILAGCAALSSVAPKCIMGGPQIRLIASVFIIFAALAFAGTGLILLGAAARRLRRDIF